jgi:hypothetical protein
MCAALWLMRFIYPGAQDAFIGDILQVTVRLIAFIVLNLPLLIFVDRKTGILKEIKKFIVTSLQRKVMPT